MIRIVTLFALIALPAQAVAQARPGACLTRAEGSAAITHVLPAALAAVTGQCGASLGPTAYLSRSGAALEARYRAEADRNAVAGRAALVKMIGPVEGVALSDTTVAELATVGVRGAIGKLKPQDCRQADEVLALVDALPPGNVAQLAVRLLDSGKQTAGAPFRFCPRS